MEEEVGMEGREEGKMERVKSYSDGFHQLSVKEFYQLGVYHFKSQNLVGFLCFCFW